MPRLTVTSTQHLLIELDYQASNGRVIGLFVTNSDTVPHSARVTFADSGQVFEQAFPPGVTSFTTIPASHRVQFDAAGDVIWPPWNITTW